MKCSFDHERDLSPSNSTMFIVWTLERECQFIDSNFVLRIPTGGTWSQLCIYYLLVHQSVIDVKREWIKRKRDITEKAINVECAWHQHFECVVLKCNMSRTLLCHVIIYWKLLWVFELLYALICICCISISKAWYLLVWHGMVPVVWMLLCY